MSGSLLAFFHLCLVSEMNAFTALEVNTFGVEGGGRMRFALVTNALKCAFKLQPHTATNVATIDFQTELLSRLLLTGTHLQKWQ